MIRMSRRGATLAAAIAATGLVVSACGDSDTTAEDVVGSVTSVAESAVDQATSAVESVTADDPDDPAADESVEVPAEDGGTVELSGPILEKYNELGGAESPLGGATGDQEDVGDGYVAEFEGGVIAWSPDTDAHVVWGEIRVAWEAEDGASGDLGFPISDEEMIPGGAQSNFQFGSITFVDGQTEVVKE